MPYLPPLKVDQAEFPNALGEDFVNNVQMIEERWRLAYPAYPYYPLFKETTSTPDPSTLTGTAQATKFDKLWGESVPATVDGKWQQPHGNPDLVATDPTVYKDEQRIHIRVQRIKREEELKKFGFDLVRNLVATIPTSLLDQAGVTAQVGDRFRWNNELMEVLQIAPTGWWYSSNVHLYVTMSVSHARRGS